MRLTSSITMLIALLLLTDVLHAQYRLRANSSYRFDGTSQSFVAQDSTQYQYQGARASDFTNRYDDYGADKSSRWFYDPGTNQWEESSRSFNNYNTNGNVFLYADFFVNGRVQQDTNKRTEYTYNSNGSISTAASYRKYSATDWEGLGKASFSYDGNGNLIETINETWDINTKSWKNNSREVNTYVGGKLTEELSYSWMGTSWQFFSRKTNKYSGNNVDTAFTEFYDIPGGVWKYSYASAYHYDANNDNDTMVAISYNASQSKWEPNQRYAYTYDISHNVLTRIIQNYSGGSFQNDMRHRMTYNAQNLRTQQIQDKWNPTSGQFEVYDNGTSAAFESFWYYEPVTAGIDEVNANNQFRVYPNPASTELFVQMQLAPQKELLSFIAYDQSGKVVHHSSAPYSAAHTYQLNLPNLPNGYYYLRNANSGRTQKIIISH